jgi:flavin reductase (DIM6/NTAB) family NADH-FMN oxidoreductase RutF
MDVDPRTLSPREAYGLLITLVVPRPIAWVSTLDAEGIANLAPFSFFGGVTTHPPIVMVSIGRRDGAPKDTAANLLATGEGVVHVCHRPLAAAMVATSANPDAATDEFELAGLAKTPSLRVAPPRIAGAAVALEARVERHLEIGAGPNDVFLLEIVHVHVDDAFVVDGRADPAKLQAVGRLGGSLYCDTAAPFEIPRP